MAIIDDFPTLSSSPTTGDELPIERGTTTYKIDYDALASAIISKLGGDPVTIPHGGTGATTANAGRIALGAAPTIYLNKATWADVYAELNKLGSAELGVFYAQNSPAVASLLTGGKVTGTIKGVVLRAFSTQFDFFGSVGTGNSIVAWRITNFTSASATPSVGSVYSYTGTAL